MKHFIDTISFDQIKFLKHQLFVVLAFILISNQLKSQPLCNPPIAINAGTDATITCGSIVNLGEIPTPPTPSPIAPSCTNAGMLTQGGGVYLNNVSTTGGINGNNISNLNSMVGGINPMGPNAWQSIWYSNYTAQIVESTPGGSFNLSIVARSINNNAPYSIRIWIDWNNDGTFDNTPGSELVYTSALSNPNPITVSNITINVPAGQQAGTFRMRIRAKDNAPFVASDNACTYNNPQGITAPYAGYTGSQTGAYWFSSEVEDYGVKISGAGQGASTGGNYTYSWSPSADLNDSSIPNPVATPPGTTVYTVTVTDVVNNCISTDQVTITVTTITPTFTNPGPVCTGTSFTLPLTSTQGITGTWSPAVNNISTTTYTFTPDAGQCSINGEMTVVITPAEVPTFNNIGSICSGSIFVLPTTSTNGITGSWSPAINNLATTTYTFTPTTGQCATTATMTVSVDSQVTPTFTNPGPICQSTAFTLPATSLNGIDGTWSPAINNSSTTTYTFTPNSTTCASNTTMSVVIDNPILPTFTNPGPICSGSALSLASTSNNGIAGTWSSAVDNTTTTTYTFTPNTVGCNASATMTVIVDNPITPTFTNPGPLCQNVPYTLPSTSLNGVTGTWSPAIDNSITTTYTFTPNNSSCTSNSTLTVVINPSFEIALTGGADVCQGEKVAPILITATGGTAPYTFTYSVNGSNPISISSNQNTATINLATTSNSSACYSIELNGTSAGACLTGTTVFPNYICTYPKAIASFTTSTSGNNLYSMNNTSTGATSYSWNFGDSSPSESVENPIHQFPNESPLAYKIILIATNDQGCSDTTSSIIKIEEDLVFYVPNAFTPDGDQYNNIFIPVMTSGFDPFNYELKIFDRWGECLFTSLDAKYGWNGTYFGKLAQIDTYIWQITFKLRNNDEKRTYTGHVNVIR